MRKKQNLIWLDLEMTGLNPDKDQILEIASVVTDKDLNVIGEGPSLVIHYPDDVLDSMNEWCIKQHAKSGLTKAVQESVISLREAELQTLSFIKQHCVEQSSPLCGNTVWQDRSFLCKYMPSIVYFAHYRIIDVSSFKAVISRWYNIDKNKLFEKKDLHRALSDIHESIEELKFYRDRFFIMP